MQYLVFEGISFLIMMSCKNDSELAESFISKNYSLEKFFNKPRMDAFLERYSNFFTKSIITLYGVRFC
jgi:hypothetical protein